MKKLIYLAVITIFLFYPVEEKQHIFVYDGDTFFLNGRKIRLAYADAPERNTPFYAMAKERLYELLTQGEVVIRTLYKDDYGREVSLVYVNDELVNLRMIEEGLAKVREHENKAPAYFLRAQRLAMKTKRGIWSEYFSCIEVFLHEDASGNDFLNLEDEYFILENICASAVAIDNWTVENGKMIVAKLNLLLEPNQKIKFTTKQLNFSKPVWSNKNPVLIIKDASGRTLIYLSRF